MQIGGHAIGTDRPTFVIAEAGSNHDGDLEQAKSLIDAAADAGADAVKFQNFRAETMYAEEAGSVGDDQSLREFVAEMEMPYDWIPELRDHCDDRGVLFMSTPLDERALDELDEYVPAFKIASSMLSHHPFLRRVAERDKPVVASTGAHDLEDVRSALSVLRDAGASEVALLHCVSSYPTPLESANVRAVATLAEEFDVPVGYSDHTTDPVVAPAAAVALGASIVEKHFTLDSDLEGADHSFALEPDELDRMITAIRDAEVALGDGSVGVEAVERDWYESARRTVHATEDLDAGEVIEESAVSALRSGERERGVEPKFLDAVVGREATRDLDAGSGIRWDDVTGDPVDE
ncbi:N-acetylneuraminate synthase family protein [Halorussus salinus]|uniref:N-acetylneuraminate synthase family protein n=1 Tax=Halorussus salinus TaxID=1364935 RepID=UPI001091AF88|nr:N-acetylneuraminate synthase family protein [Halorussus salinus]